MTSLGYLSPQYAASLGEFGTLRYLSACGGWIIERKIPGTSDLDAMGCYPLFLCRDWAKLKFDIDNLDEGLVSISMVTDPFADISYSELRNIFDVCYPFKEHYITDLTQPLENIIGKKTRKHARKALEKININRCKDPNNFLQDWVELYNHLIKRHNISGIPAFSINSFQKLMVVPGMEIFIASLQKKILGAEIFLVRENIVYAHLVSIIPTGYEYNVSYALDWSAIEFFKQNNFDFLDQGAGAGLKQHNDGLTQYKRKWANTTRPVYFCGKILDQSKYEKITAMKNMVSIDYFPSYRNGEFK